MDTNDQPQPSGNVIPSASASGATSTNKFTKRFAVRRPIPGTKRMEVVEPLPMPAPKPKGPIVYNSPLSNPDTIAAALHAHKSMPMTPALAPTVQDPRLEYFDRSVTVHFHLDAGTFNSNVTSVHRSNYAVTIIAPLEANSLFIPKVGTICEISIGDGVPFEVLYQGVEVDIKPLGIKLITFITSN